MIKYYFDPPLDSRIAWLGLERGSIGASGYDLMANIGTERTINPGERWLIGTGLHLEMPIGVEAQVRSRSGLAINHGVIVLNAPGTVDSDYRGEVCVTLYNAGVRHTRGEDGLLVEGQPFVIHPGMRIAQLVFARVIGVDMAMPEQVEAKRAYHSEPTRVAHAWELSQTERGGGGHGSTGH